MTQPGRVQAPIIVLGAPRSGTTLLADLLDAHPDVAVAREPRLVWRYGNDRRSDELRPEHARPEVVDHIHGTFATLLAEQGRTRLAEKTPANALRPAFVDAVFPDARFVHITRDGWGTVPSMRAFWLRRGSGLDGKQVRKLRRRLREAKPSQLRFYAAEVVRRGVGGRRHVSLYGPRLSGLQQIADELGLLEAAARQWQACVHQTSAFGRQLPAARYLEVQLERLDPGGLRAILDFAGLAPSEEVEDRFRNQFDRGAATRKAPLDDGERRLVAPYVEPANRWLGYAPGPLDRSGGVPAGAPPATAATSGGSR